MSELVVLGDLAEVIDCEHKTAPPARGGEEFGYSIGTRDLRGGRMDLQTAKRVSREVFEAWTGRGVPSAGDLILAREAPVGQVAYVSGKHPVCLGQRTVLIRVDDSKVDGRYLHSRLLAPDSQSWMADRSTGSTVAHLNVADVRRIPLPGLPPINEQRRITGVLGAFDDLIDTNTQLASRAQLLAVALLEGAEEVISLSEVAVPLKAIVFRPVGTVEHYSLPAFDAGGRPEIVDGGEIKSGKQRLVAPSVLVSRLNPQTPRVWMTYPTGDAAASTEFAILVGKDDVAAEEIWAACSSQTFASDMRSRVTGTTGSHQRVDKAAIPIIEVPDPRSLSTPQRQAVVSLAQQADASLAEVADLAQVRDELLPLLMSGRITVDEAWVAVS